MSFAEHGISGKIETKDGKKFFDVPNVRIDQILNLPITVTDFESDLDTKHGKGRYVVKILNNGRDQKFITNAFKLKSMLDQAKERNLFPIDTRITKMDTGGKFADYCFE